MADEKKEASFGKKFKTIFLAFIFGMIFVALASYCLSCYFIDGTIHFRDIMGTVTSPTYRNTFLLSFGVVLLIFLIAFSNSKFKFDSGGAKVSTKGGIKKFYDTNWLTTEELRKNPDFKFHLYEDLHRSDNIGVPIRAELIGNKLHVNMYKPIHTMVIGTTGAGKTTQFINPTVQILSETHAKPCLVITDPKGEIYDDHSEKLRKNGYRILVFDLKEPFQSTRWNPMTRAYEINERAMNLNREVKVHHNDDPRDFSPKCVSSVYCLSLSQNLLINRTPDCSRRHFSDRKTSPGF